MLNKYVSEVKICALFDLIQHTYITEIIHKSCCCNKLLNHLEDRPVISTKATL